MTPTPLRFDSGVKKMGSFRLANGCHQGAGAFSEALRAEAHPAPQRPAPEVRERRAQHSGAVVKAGVVGYSDGETKLSESIRNSQGEVNRDQRKDMTLNIT